MKFKLSVIISCVFFLFASQSKAWNYTGHMVVAKIAYQHLTPHTKKEVNRLTHQLDRYYPQTRSFVLSAFWPDLLKGQDVTAFNSWHYINQPLASSKQPLPPVSKKNNVVWAISQSVHVLKSSKSNDFEKAIFLRFLIHFTGDIHQPLHCASLYSPLFVQGDHGGSLYTVNSSYGNNLHEVWDRGLGFFKLYSGKDRVTRIANQIEKNYPERFFGNKSSILKPRIWADESYQLAKQFAYPTAINAPLNEEYIQKGREVTQMQIAVAGYRLAKILNDIFDAPMPLDKQQIVSLGKH